MASKKLSSDTSLANSYKLSRGVASVARPSAPTIGTATDTGVGLMSVTFTASTLGPTASSYTLTSSSGVTGSGASSPLTLKETAVGTYTYSVSGVNANGTGPSSAASNSVNVASVFAPSGAYDSIATSAGGAATITFSSIPATYQHLQLRALVRVTSGTSGTDNLGFRLNSDSGSNYAYHYLSGSGASAAVSGGTSQTGMLVRDMIPRNSFTANVYGVLIIDILDYANTSKYKTTRTLSGMDGNGSGTVALNSGLWQSTSAVTSISLYDFDNTSYAFSSDSSFALYGIKGA